MRKITITNPINAHSGLYSPAHSTHIHITTLSFVKTSKLTRMKPAVSKDVEGHAKTVS